MCGFDGAQKVNFLRGEPIRTEVEERARKIWNECFEDLCSVDTRKEVSVHMCGFDGIRRVGCFGGEPIGGAEELRVGKLKNGGAAGKGEITGG